ncbi:hypothetical protein F4808DRAFT_407775 [Astrocystis sublimbata]|nr:hypothetical protein F4808DRAFT_407775 [Astrocystis sublimbata]
MTKTKRLTRFYLSKYLSSFSSCQAPLSCSLPPLSHQVTMTSKLILPQCEQTPICVNHPPEWEKPLRIQINAHYDDLDKVFEDGMKMPRLNPMDVEKATDFHEAGLRLARMAFRLLYGRDPDLENPSDMVPRHQYRLWERATKDHDTSPLDSKPMSYNITFDHLLGEDDEDDPETLMLNSVDPHDASVANLMKIDMTPYMSVDEPVVLLVPRCCQTRAGTTDRWRINVEIKEAKLSPEAYSKLRDEEDRAYREKLERKRKKKEAQALTDAVGSSAATGESMKEV